MIIMKDDDLVRRKDVELALLEKGQRSRRYKLGETWELDYTEIREALSDVPAAQPEIIRCNSCKYWTQTTGEMKGYGLGWCDFHEAHMVSCNGFCYWAERREE